jgi:tetratricopeptide (TPR) repeat protein
MKMNQVETQRDNALTTTSAVGVSELCERAKQLEEAGKFEEARVALGEFWQRVGDRPKLEGLMEPVRAELLLRVGTLSGWIGSVRQIPGAQEIAKDLISESAAIFEKLGLIEKVAEARVDLGICYWREGALDEARITFDDGLQKLGDLDSEQRLRALLNKAIVEQVSFRPKEALRLLSESESLFLKSNNHALRGKFHNELATVLKNVGLAERREDYIDRALMQYTAASLDLESTGHESFRASVENNLGLLFCQLKRFEDAHEHLNRALSVASRLNDKGLRAQFEDTRARTFIAQGRFEQAAKVARAAVKGLKEGDQQSHLAAALTTHATALARIGRHRDALAMLNDAAIVASQAGDPEVKGIACITIVEELASTLSPAELRHYYKTAEAALANSQHAAIQLRLAECARSVLALEEHSTSRSQEAPVDATAANISLEEQVLRYEGELIKRALDTAEGSVTRAARLLGITHQGLAFILNGRQKNLLPSRKPAKPRRRSIIRYH